MRPAVGRYHARLVDHLLLDRDEAWTLHDLQAVVVDARHHHPGQAARDAAYPGAQVLGAGRRAAVGICRGRDQRLPLGGQRRQPPVGRVDDHRDLRRWRISCEAERRVAPFPFVAPDASERAALAPGRRFLGGQRRDLGGVERSFERNAVRRIAGPDPLQIGSAPGRSRDGVGLARLRRHRGQKFVPDDAGPADLDHGDPDVVGTRDERPRGVAASIVRHGRRRFELDTLLAHRRGGLVEVRYAEAQMIERAPLGRCGHAVLVPGDEQPRIVEPQAVDLPGEPGRHPAENVAIPGHSRGRIGRTQLNVVKAELVAILHERDSRAPGVEDEREPEGARGIAERRAVGEPLQSYARAADADGFKFAHPGREIGDGESDVVDARALSPAERRCGAEDHLDAVAGRGVSLPVTRRAAEVLGVPVHRLDRTRYGEMHMVESCRCRDAGCQRKKYRDARDRRTEDSGFHAGKPPHGVRITPPPPFSGGRTRDFRKTPRT